jgi:hypothetical protein
MFRFVIRNRPFESPKLEWLRLRVSSTPFGAIPTTAARKTGPEPPLCPTAA